MRMSIEFNKHFVLLAVFYFSSLSLSYHLLPSSARKITEGISLSNDIWILNSFKQRFNGSSRNEFLFLFYFSFSFFVCFLKKKNATFSFQRSNFSFLPALLSGGNSGTSKHRPTGHKYNLAITYTRIFRFVFSHTQSLYDRLLSAVADRPLLARTYRVRIELDTAMYNTLIVEHTTLHTEIEERWASREKERCQERC